MYNRLSFEDKLSHKYLYQNILQIQKRKSLYPQKTQKVAKKRALVSIASQKQIHEQNWQLVKKLIQVKHSPAFVSKMFMGSHDKGPKQQKMGKVKRQRLLGRKSSISHSMRQLTIQQQNLRLKKTLQGIKQCKKGSVFPSI